MENNLDQRVQELIAAGCSVTHAATFAATSLTPSEVVEYERAGLGLEHIHHCQMLNISPGEFKKWQDLLFLSSYAHQVIKTGISLEDASQIFKGRVEPERSTLVRLIERNFSVSEILLLQQYGAKFAEISDLESPHLRENLLSAAFGSKLIRQAWKLTGLADRESLAASRLGLTPWTCVQGLPVETSRPICSWIVEEKRYEFGDVGLPAVFAEAVGETRNDDLLSAIGYDVRTKKLKTSFVKSVQPIILMETGTLQGTKVIVGLSQVEDKWKSSFLVLNGVDDFVRNVGGLVEVGVHAMQQLQSKNLLVKSFSIEPNLKNTRADYFLAMQEWCTDRKDDDLPKINGNSSVRLKTIDGQLIVLPIVDIEPRPGRDLIKRLGDVALRFLGMDLSPVVVISVENNDVVRNITKDVATRVKAKSDGAVLLRRHTLHNPDEYEGDFSRDSFDSWMDTFDTNELFISIENFDDQRNEPPFTIAVSEREYLEILIDESQLSTADVAQCLKLENSNDIDYGEFVEYSTEDLDALKESDLTRDIDVLHQISSEFGLPYWERIEDNYLKFAPVSINGVGYLSHRDPEIGFLKFDTGDYTAVPEIDEYWASFGIIENGSMTSGTDSDSIGLVRPGLLSSNYQADEGESSFVLQRIEMDSYAQTFVNWLLTDDFGNKFRALYYLESKYGEIPDHDEISAAWFVEEASTTLMMSLGFGAVEGVSDDEILELLLRDFEARKYYESIVDPTSAEGVARAKRQKEYLED